MCTKHVDGRNESITPSEPRSIARRMAVLDQLCLKISIPELSSYVSEDLSKIDLDEFPRNEWPEDMCENWYDASHATATIHSILENWNLYPGNDAKKDWVKKGLLSLKDILHQLQHTDTRFHLAIRI